MSAGTMISAITSLRANRNLRKNKESYSKFYKKHKANNSGYQMLTTAESLNRREEAKLKRTAQRKEKRMFQRAMGIFYAGILIYVLYVVIF